MKGLKLKATCAFHVLSYDTMDYTEKLGDKF